MPRLLHASFTVDDLPKSIAFYTETLGLKLLQGPVHYANNVDRAFVGDDWNAYIELVLEPEVPVPYDHGNRYKHIALEIEGPMDDVLDDLRRKGVKVLTGARRPEGKRVTAHIEDPNGVIVELLETAKPGADQLW